MIISKVLLTLSFSQQTLLHSYFLGQQGVDDTCIKGQMLSMNNSPKKKNNFLFFCYNVTYEKINTIPLFGSLKEQLEKRRYYRWRQCIQSLVVPC